MAVTVSDVEKLDSLGWEQLNSDKKDELLTIAESLVDGQLSERQSNFSTLQGNRDEAVQWLAAHFYELAEGGEAQSESSQGGNVNYNTVTGEWQNSLSETRYGRLLSDMYLRDRQGLGLVRTH
jgi:hypothetical protein